MQNYIIFQYAKLIIIIFFAKKNRDGNYPSLLWGWRRPTFPQANAVSSARRGLTSLFGMGRGGPPCYSHHVSLHVSTWLQKENARVTLAFRKFFQHFVPLPSQCCHPDLVREVFGLLVALGFDVAAFTPAPYQRVRLTRP